MKPLLIFSTSLLLLLGFSNSQGPNEKETFKQKIITSTNYKEGKFRNNPEVETNTGSYWGMLKKWMTGDEIREPVSRLPTRPININNFFSGIDTGLTFSWIGHSTILLEIEGKKILTDPVFANNTSPVPYLYSVDRFQEAPPIKVADLPQLDAVVVSHDHFDHLDKMAIKEAHPKIKYFLVPLGVESHLIEWGVPANKIVSLDWGDSTTIDGITYLAEQAQHFSGRSLLLNRTLWASWIIRGKKRKIYFSGDTGYFKGFRRIGEKHGPFDITFLDCAQYDEHWKTVHMFPEEAVKAHLELQGNYLVPLHWGTFGLAYHSWYEPVERLLLAAHQKGIPVITPVPGEVVTYPLVDTSTRWWVDFK